MIKYYNFNIKLKIFLKKFNVIILKMHFKLLENYKNIKIFTFNKIIIIIIKLKNISLNINKNYKYNNN
jgi:hypothetical protein